MTDIPIGSPMHRAMQEESEQRATGLLTWLFSRGDAPDSRWHVSGPSPTVHRCELVAEKGRER